MKCCHFTWRSPNLTFHKKPSIFRKKREKIDVPKVMVKITAWFLRGKEKDVELGYKAYSVCVCVCVCSESRWFGLTNITPRDVAGGNVVTAKAKDLRPNCLNSVESAGNERFEWEQGEVYSPLSTTGELVPIPLTWHSVFSYSIL